MSASQHRPHSQPPRPVFLPSSLDDCAKVLSQNSKGKFDVVTRYLRNTLDVRPEIIQDRPITGNLSMKDKQELCQCYRNYFAQTIRKWIGKKENCFTTIIRVPLIVTRADFVTLLEGVPKKHNDRLMKAQIAVVRNNETSVIQFDSYKYIRHIITKSVFTYSSSMDGSKRHLTLPIKFHVMGEQRSVFAEFNSIAIA